MSRGALWSCGGGRQSAGIAALIKLGELPKPDHVAMVHLEWEITTVWPYVNRYIRPAMESMGIPFTQIERKDYAKVGFWSKKGNVILLPVYSDQSGEVSKLPEYCSGEWKREVVKRWAAEQEDWKVRGVDMLVGISAEESHRRRAPQRRWIQPFYPLLDVRRTSVNGCLQAVKKVGWPDPPRSRCSHCPNQSDKEWAELSEEEWEQVCKLDEEIREKDPHAFLHKSMLPLRLVTLKPKEEQPGFVGGCSAGMCY